MCVRAFVCTCLLVHRACRSIHSPLDADECAMCVNSMCSARCCHAAAIRCSSGAAFSTACWIQRGDCQLERTSQYAAAHAGMLGQFLVSNQGARTDHSSFVPMCSRERDRGQTQVSQRSGCGTHARKILHDYHHRTNSYGTEKMVSYAIHTV